ncbi:MAG: DRTGG domain-containing protein [Bacteroidota bacterium]|nr:DRTGG domain-containing protein [Bacteroidota bacterium]
MKVAELITQLSLTAFTGKAGLDREIEGGYVSDLLSDVMGHSQAGQIWITLQTHKNVIAIASLKDLSAVILVKGNTPGEEALAQAIEEGIPILGTQMDTFEIAGRIYNLLRQPS